ncbi:hypothetical protein [Spiroplasma citri]|uniref:hypothetical protein n=1 Tax=Spiroplasma citri TaxID=2133 RepID=UPI0020A5D372|nr:hypothetical protein [Spiroplasma citri]
MRKFSFYNLFLNLEFNHQAVKINSYSGYTYYYWDQQNPWKYNQILGEATELKNNEDNFTLQQELNTGLQEKYRYDNDQCIEKTMLLNGQQEQKLKLTRLFEKE